MKIKIEGINIKDPVEGINKNGKKFKRWGIGIKTDTVQPNETGWINATVWNEEDLVIPRTWKEGDEVDLNVKHDEKWGWQFEIPKGEPNATEPPLNIEPGPATKTLQMPPAQTDPETHIKDDLEGLEF